MYFATNMYDLVLKVKVNISLSILFSITEQYDTTVVVNEHYYAYVPVIFTRTYFELLLM